MLCENQKYKQHLSDSVFSKQYSTFHNAPLTMGAPEFPGDENDRQNQFQPPPSHALPMHGIETSEDDDVDSNDDDATVPPAGDESHQDAQSDQFDPSQPYAAEGYHPLNFEIRTADDGSDSDDNDDDDDLSSSSPSNAGDETEVAVAEIETTAEREILSEIWNAPRPVDSADIALDSDKAEQVRKRVVIDHQKIYTRN